MARKCKCTFFLWNVLITSDMEGMFQVLYPLFVCLYLWSVVTY